MWEVAFYHKPSRTLILVDWIENFSDRTPHLNWVTYLWLGVIFRLWQHPQPAPEYQLGWQQRAAAQRSLQTILNWDFERIILAHGDLIETNAKAQARAAWTPPLVVDMSLEPTGEDLSGPDASGQRDLLQ